MSTDRLALPELSGMPRAVWNLAQGITCLLTLELSVPALTVGDLLRLEKGSIIDTQWTQGIDLALRVNGEIIGWTEFEVVGERLAVRLTELE